MGWEDFIRLKKQNKKEEFERFSLWQKKIIIRFTIELTIKFYNDCEKAYFFKYKKMSFQSDQFVGFNSHFNYINKTCFFFYSCCITIFLRYNCFFKLRTLTQKDTTKV